MPRHATSGSFKEGVSGNPAGSSKRVREFGRDEAARLARMCVRYSPEAVELLAKEMRAGETSATRISAANSILDRALGKPPQAVDVLVTKQINDLSLDQLIELENRLSGLAIAAIAPPSIPHNDTVP